mmetsp:Transcript_1028/g.2186  ORF Transcript_1028/g.2186 Transcript_1028/m.2186 type:complete len:259 (-) Transcript_1028:60-836(-)
MEVLIPASLPHRQGRCLDNLPTRTPFKALGTHPVPLALPLQQEIKALPFPQSGGQLQRWASASPAPIVECPRVPPPGVWVCMGNFKMSLKRKTWMMTTFSSGQRFKRQSKKDEEASAPMEQHPLPRYTSFLICPLCHMRRLQDTHPPNSRICAQEQLGGKKSENRFQGGCRSLGGPVRQLQPLRGHIQVLTLQRHTTTQKVTVTFLQCLPPWRLLPRLSCMKHPQRHLLLAATAGVLRPRGNQQRKVAHILPELISTD